MENSIAHQIFNKKNHRMTLAEHKSCPKMKCQSGSILELFSIFCMTIVCHLLVFGPYHLYLNSRQRLTLSWLPGAKCKRIGMIFAHDRSFSSQRLFFARTVDQLNTRNVSCLMKLSAFIVQMWLPWTTSRRNLESIRIKKQKTTNSRLAGQRKDLVIFEDGDWLWHIYMYIRSRTSRWWLANGYTPIGPGYLNKPAHISYEQ